MNNELLEALNILEKEKNISKEILLEAIETSLITACKNHFGKSDNVRVDMNPETCEYHVYQGKTVVEEVEDPVLEISLANAKMIHSSYNLGDIVNIEIKSKEFGRIATQNAKNVILQKIREEERKILCDEFYSKERDIVTGIVQRYIGRNISINLGKVDAILTENEQVRGESFKPTERIKLYILEVKSTSKGPKVLVSRTHPELVRRLFESEVAEVREGIVEIKSIAREAGSRTKIAVYSNDPDVDAVGACVGMNGTRVNAVVQELQGEKIDIITWNDNPAMLIENALSPAKVISVIADGEEKSAKVVVPDYQLSLAIGKEGQNARLAARLTGFKIDIKSETQAREAGDFIDYENDYEDEDDFDAYEEDGYGDEDEYSQDGYGDEDGYSQDGYGDEDGYSENGYSEEDGYSNDGYDQEEALEDSFAEDGYDQEENFEEGYSNDGQDLQDGYAEDDSYGQDGDIEESPEDAYSGNGEFEEDDDTGEGAADDAYEEDGEEYENESYAKDVDSENGYPEESPETEGYEQNGDIEESPEDDNTEESPEDDAYEENEEAGADDEKEGVWSE